MLFSIRPAREPALAKTGNRKSLSVTPPPFGHSQRRPVMILPRSRVRQGLASLRPTVNRQKAPKHQMCENEDFKQPGLSPMFFKAVNLTGSFFWTVFDPSCRLGSRSVALSNTPKDLRLLRTLGILSSRVYSNTTGAW